MVDGPFVGPVKKGKAMSKDREPGSAPNTEAEVFRQVGRDPQPPVSPMDREVLVQVFETCRAELESYLTRMVLRPCVAEELVQDTAVKALEALPKGPQTAAEVRPWLFRIATNLAIDERRRHGSWRESLFDELRRFSHTTPGYEDQFPSWRGTPELKTVAKDHLAACFACTNSRLPHNHAAALLLREVYQFTNEEIGDMLDAGATQVKNWIQKARTKMRSLYASRCALIRKEGVCYQCEELDKNFQAQQGNPLRPEGDELDQRLGILREMRTQPQSKWSRFVDRAISALLEEG